MKKAFSLVELSIVLIVVALLIAGISSGSKLIENAKINDIITQIQKMNNAVTIFRTTYNAFPGDMANAQDFFGVGVTNGNGDGIIPWASEGANAATTDLVSQHIVAAEILPEPESRNGVHPTINMIDQTWGIGIASMGLWNNKYPSRYRMHIHHYPYVDTDSGTPIKTSILYSIDRKTDDALPNSGIVMSTGRLSTCTASNTTCCTNNLNMHQTSFDADTLKNATYNNAVQDECSYLFVELTTQQ